MMLFLLSIVIAISAVIYGIYVGRAQAERIREIPDTVRTMRSLDWVKMFIIFAGIFWLFSTLNKHENEFKKNSLREQFRLPSDITLLDLKHGDPTRQRVTFSAKVNFDSRQWSDYIGDIDDRSVWQPKPLRRSIPINLPFTENSLYNKGQPIDGDYSPDAKLWEKLPKPLMAEDLGDMHINDVARLYHIWWACA